MSAMAVIRSPWRGRSSGPGRRGRARSTSGRRGRRAARPPQRARRSGQRLGNVVEDALATLLLALDLVPAQTHGVCASGLRSSKHMRVASHELLMHVAGHLLQAPMALLREEKGHEVDLEQEIAELVE